VQLRTPTGYCKDPPASEHPMRHGWHRRCHAMSRVAYRHHGPVARRTYSCVGARVVGSSDYTITTRERAFFKLHFMADSFLLDLPSSGLLSQIDKSVSRNVSCFPHAGRAFFTHAGDVICLLSVVVILTYYARATLVARPQTYSDSRRGRRRKLPGRPDRQDKYPHPASSAPTNPKTTTQKQLPLNNWLEESAS